MAKQSIDTRLKALERDRPSDAGIINYLTRPGSDGAMAARIARYTPAYIRQMTNDDLIAFIQSDEGPQL